MSGCVFQVFGSSRLVSAQQSHSVGLTHLEKDGIEFPRDEVQSL